MDVLTNPLVLLVVVIVIALVVAGVVLASKKKQDIDDEEYESRPVRGKKSSNRNVRQGKVSEQHSETATKKRSVKTNVESESQPKKEIHRTADEDDPVLETEDTDENEWDDWNKPVISNAVDDTKVSVQDVDPETEYSVYKQFGYVDKAAESLALYLKNHPEKTSDKSLIGELLDLWLQAKKVDEFSDALTQYQEMFEKAELVELVKQGLALEANHLGLRVLAESRLGWSVKKTANEIGEQTEETQNVAERPKLLLPNQQAEEEAAAQAAAKAARKPLVVGEAPLGQMDNDEKGAVLSFMQPEQSMKLLKGMLRYDVANRYLSKAIRASSKPAVLLIDALTMDFKAKNLRNFVEHLWNLYYSLGQGGRQVKERMLGLGYSMGEHPIFGMLEANANDAAVLREIGVRLGFIEISAAAKKARHKSLVNEKVDVDTEPKTPAERVLKEVEFLLVYGQLDQAMDLLESSVKEYTQEAQLYVTLFDLYERAEEWARFGKLVQELRPQFQTLPEEVVLAMSQLLQRYNNHSAIGR